jgi:predicted nuclease of predicted toxin-antitoxin system
VRLWFDEDLSPTLVQVAEEHGFEATCNRDRGMLGSKDHELRRVVQAESFVLVTDNAADFRPMFVRDAIHPGLVVLPGTVLRDRQQVLASIVIDYIVELARKAGERPADFMVNKLVEVDDHGECSVQELPPD